MSGIAVVLGSSAAALAEFAAARAFLDAHGSTPLVVCVNDSIRFCPVKPAAFCTIHSANVPDRFIPKDMDVAGVAMFTRKPVHGFNSRVVRAKWLGTSGLYGVQIALDALDCAGAILAGVPMDARAGTNYGRDTWADDAFVENMRAGWAAALPDIAGRVRSMSGWTRDLLGAPSADWLAVLASRAAQPSSPP